MVFNIQSRRQFSWCLSLCESFVHCSLFHLPNHLEEGPDSISQAAEQISAVPAASFMWLPVVNLRVLIQSSTLSESKALVIFLIRLFISVVHIILVFWWRANSCFFVMLTQPCLSVPVRILAQDENTVTCVSSVQILEYCSVLILFHISCKEICI